MCAHLSRLQQLPASVVRPLQLRLGDLKLVAQALVDVGHLAAQHRQLGAARNERGHLLF